MAVIRQLLIEEAIASAAHMPCACGLRAKGDRIEQCGKEDIACRLDPDEIGFRCRVRFDARCQVCGHVQELASFRRFPLEMAEMLESEGVLCG